MEKQIEGWRPSHSDGNTEQQAHETLFAMRVEVDGYGLCLGLLPESSGDDPATTIATEGS